MTKTHTGIKRLRYYLKWTIWVLLVQLVLVNISAAFYAFKLTHFYDQLPVVTHTQNVIDKTWKIFVGPKFYKNTVEPLPNFPVEKVNLTTSDQLNIEAWYSSVDSARTCVIFFHGLSANKSFLSNEAAMFRKWGYNVMLVDMRAHGNSEGNTSTYGIKETDEVQKAFEWAGSKGNEKIILYGMSMGSAVALKAVADKKIQPAAIIADMPFNNLRQLLGAKAEDLGFPSEPFATLVTFWIGIERGYNGFEHRVPDYATKVHCPVLVQWGARDRFVDREEITEIYDHISSTHKKLVIYPDADHQSLLVVDPLAWEKEVKNFLSTLP